MHLLESETSLSGLDLFVLSDSLASYDDGPHYCPALCAFSLWVLMNTDLHHFGFNHMVIHAVICDWTSLTNNFRALDKREYLMVIFLIETICCEPSSKTSQNGSDEGSHHMIYAELTKIIHNYYQILPLN